MKKTKLITAFAAATAALVITGTAASISISTTAPTTNAGLDEWNYAAPTGTQKWFHDVEHDAGQTFTPTTSGMLNSFTIYLSQQNNNDAGDENVDFRFGTITRPLGEFTFNQTYVENAALAPSPGGDWAANDYITFTLVTPQAVTAGVEYGVITDAIKMGGWQTPGGGIPYRHTTGNAYGAGVMINRGGENASRDIVFHADITAIPEPSTTALLGLGGLALILRRRK